MDTLKKGAKIRVVDGAGTFTYKVTGVHTVVAGQRDVVLPTKDNRITLVTANSTTVPNGRLVVQGKLVGPAVVVPNHTVAVPSYELGLDGDPVAGGLAAFWSIITLLVLLVAAYRGLAVAPAVAGLPLRRPRAADVRAVRLRERGPGPPRNLLSLAPRRIRRALRARFPVRFRHAEWSRHLAVTRPMG